MILEILVILYLLTIQITNHFFTDHCFLDSIITNSSLVFPLKDMFLYQQYYNSFLCPKVTECHMRA